MRDCREVLTPLVFLTLLPCAASAADLEPTLAPSPIETGRYGSNSPRAPAPCSFSQNPDFEILESGAAIACSAAGGTTDNQFLRLFDLDGEHGFAGQVCVESLDYAVELSEGGVELTFNVYCTPQGLADDSIGGSVDRDVLDPGLVHSVTITHPDVVLQYLSQPLGGCCNADSQDMAIEIATEDCLESGNCVAYFPGANFNYHTQTKPWYIGAPDCGIEDPVDAVLIAFRNSPVLMRVNAQCDDPGVPAVTALGMVAMLLLFGGVSAYILRRASPTP